MDKEELRTKLEIIFDREGDLVGTGRSPPFIYEVKGLGAEDGGVERRSEIHWDSYITLKKLFKAIEKDSALKNLFIAELKREIVELGDVQKSRSLLGSKLVKGVGLSKKREVRRKASSLAFYFLLKIGLQDEAIDSIREIADIALFRDLALFLIHEPHLFDYSSLQVIKQVTTEICPSLDLISSRILNGLEIPKQINCINYSRLKQELSGVNEQINIDKQVVIHKLSAFNFDPKLEKFLQQLDEVEKLPNLETVNSGMISNLRAFFEVFIKQIAEKLKSETKVEYPKDKQSEMGNLREYLKQQLVLSKEDNDFITSFITLLHKEGGHAFFSEARYLIMSKNIGIEIAYFLISKYEDFIKKKPV